MKLDFFDFKKRKLEEIKFRDLIQYLPSNDKIIHEDESRYGKKIIINPAYFSLDHDGSFIQDCWRDLAYSFLKDLSSKILGSDHWITFKLFPYVDSDFSGEGISLNIVADCFINPTKSVVIPELIFEKIPNTFDVRIREWKCGYCKSPNKLIETHCAKCGATRPFLIQEAI